MPETYVIEIPGAPTADRTRMLRDELNNAIRTNTPFPLARAFEILPLTKENQALAEKLSDRGLMAVEESIVDGVLAKAFVNEGTSIDEKIVDQSLREFSAYIPRRVRLAAQAGDETLSLRSEGSNIIATITSLPPELGFGERFVLRSVEFTQDTVLIDFPEEDNNEHLLRLKINLGSQATHFRILRQRLGNTGQRNTLALVTAEATGDFPCCFTNGDDDDNQPLPGVQNISIHFKILRTQAEVNANNPSLAIINQTIATQVASMRQVYGQSFNIIQLTTEALTVADVDINAGTCTMGNTSNEQNTVFQNRNNVGATDLVIYLVRTLATTAGNGLDGCASHPAGRPGAIIRRAPGSAWVLGHEIGHVLDLRHVTDNTRLMFDQFLGNIVNPPPDIIGAEIRTMQNSQWTT
jgi:hypothetical protein